MLAKEVRILAAFELYRCLLIPIQGARLREKAGQNDDNESDSESDDESIDEEIGFISPLDNVDPYVSFKTALTGISPIHIRWDDELIHLLPSVPNEEPWRIPGCHDFAQR